MSLDIKPSVIPLEAPPGFHMLSKPTGAACNLDCKYCFFLSKDALYPNDEGNECMAKRLAPVAKVALYGKVGKSLPGKQASLSAGKPAGSNWS